MHETFERIGYRLFHLVWVGHESVHMDMIFDDLSGYSHREVGRRSGTNLMITFALGHLHPPFFAVFGLHVVNLGGPVANEKIV
jgi:hypothetical protein